MAHLNIGLGIIDTETIEDALTAAKRAQFSSSSVNGLIRTVELVARTKPSSAARALLHAIKIFNGRDNSQLAVISDEMWRHAAAITEPEQILGFGVRVVSDGLQRSKLYNRGIEYLRPHRDKLVKGSDARGKTPHHALKDLGLI